MNPSNSTNSTNQIVLSFGYGNKLKLVEQLLKSLCGFGKVRIVPESREQTGPLHPGLLRVCFPRVDEKDKGLMFGFVNS